MTTPWEEIETDVLILGAGGAGLLAAMHLRRKQPSLRVTVVVKGLLGQSGCTRMVQGGYNAVLNPADSLQHHYEDTIRGGGFLNHQELAWKLVEEAPKRIVELENTAGCLFDRNADGSIHQKAFAGQSFDRTVHKGDLTGIEIMSNLRDWILANPEIRVLQECRGLDLLVDSGRVHGALLLQIHTGKMIAARSRAVLLATGGGARMYRISSPSLEKSGDGMAMGQRAGAQFVDMEMLQFHPTGLLVGGSTATGGLLEEGLRGAGAYLFNGLGERFMERYDPQKMERATRDVISRSSFLEIMAGRGTPAGGVHIDVTHLGEEFVAKNFPGMVERCRDYGFDLLRERVEVSPSAHYQMGGMVIDPECRTTVEGLFAAGEDAGGVHGANRLGGNGVADSIVFGGVAGDCIPHHLLPSRPATRAQVDELCQRWTVPIQRVEGGSVFPLRRRLEDLLWDKVGVVRNGPALEEAVHALQGLEDELDTVKAPGNAASNPAWNEILGLRNTLLVARMVAESALLRTESRGAHYRQDYPGPDPLWLKNIFLNPRGGHLRPSTQPVAFTRLRPPEMPNAKPV